MDRNCWRCHSRLPSIPSLSARRAWIEIEAVIHTPIGIMWSLSARRAWIEIGLQASSAESRWVALRKESVDRNLGNQVLRVSAGVALRKESVDRNQSSVPLDPIDIRSLSARRAWIEIHLVRDAKNGGGSLSARRAWIEIVKLLLISSELMSLSARRAWIEIDHQSNARRPESVALRKESVDRNLSALISCNRR